MRKRIVSFLLCLSILIGVVAFITPQAYAASEMKMSDDGIAYLKSVEGFSKYPYYDYGQYTVGYGTRCPGDKYSYYKANGITEEEAEKLLKEFLTYFEGEINTKLIDKYGLTMTQSQFDALVSFSFNIGTSWLSSSKMSTIKTTIVTNGSPNDMAYAFSLYCHAGGEILPGLVTRRLCEANMYLNGVYSKARGEDFGYVYYDANGGYVDGDIQGFLVSTNPIPALEATCNDHTFMGWYTDIVGGTKITSLTSNLIGKTLFAHWDTEEGVDVNPMDPVTVRVGEDGVNVRKGPGTNYDKLGKANEGDELVITRVINGTSGMKWGQFDKGWICLDYTNYEDVIAGIPNDAEEPEDEEPKEDESEESVENETPIATGTVKVSDSLRIRSGPGTTYETVGYLRNGDEVDIFETKDVDEMTWGRIGNGKWTSLAYVEVDEKESVEAPAIPSDPTEPSEDSTEPGEDVSEPTVPDETQPTDPSTPDETEPNNPETSDPSEPEEDPSVPPEPDETNPATPEETVPPETEPSDPTNPTEHVHEYTDSVIGATCEKGGYTTHTCACGDTYDDNATDALGHDWTSWTVVSEATSENEGSEERSCSRCGKKESRSIDKLPEETKPAEPEEPKNPTGTVKVNDSLRVRSGPGTSYSTVGVLYNGDKVTILEQEDANGMTWGKIGDSKWISLNYVVMDKADGSKEEPEQEEQKTITGIITADCLRIRKNAGTNHAPVGYLYHGTQVAITEQKAVGNTTWGKINNGWISMDYVKVTNSSSANQNKDDVKVITADCLRIRQGAGTHTKTIGYLYEGDKVTILEIKMVDNTEWGRISKGWISLKYTK